MGKGLKQQQQQQQERCQGSAGLGQVLLQLHWAAAADWVVQQPAARRARPASCLQAATVAVAAATGHGLLLALPLAVQRQALQLQVPGLRQPGA